MFKFLQSNVIIRYVLVVLLVFLGIAMLFFGNVSSVDPGLSGGDKNFAQIDGKLITEADYRQTYQSLFAYYSLMQGRILDDTEQTVETINNMTWQWLLLLRGAEELGVRVANEEVAKQIISLPPFQQNGRFDRQLYTQFLQVINNRLGMTEPGFEKLVREQIAVERFQEVLVSPVQVTTYDVDQQFNQIFSPVKMAVVLFTFDPFYQEAKATPEEIQALYDENVDGDIELRTPERRQVKYVKFLLKPADQGLEGPERARALNALQAEALRFFKALVPEEGPLADFDQVAKDQGLKVEDSGLFDFEGQPKGISKEGEKAFVDAAFSATTEKPLGRVQLPNGFAILKLETVADTEPQPLDKVKTILVERIRQQKAEIMLLESAGASLSELSTKMKAGQSFLDAAKELGLKVENLPEFVPGNPETNEDQGRLALVKGLAVQMKPGDVSRMIPLADNKGLMVASLLERGTPDTEQFGRFRSRIQAQLKAQARDAILQEWIRLQMSNPKTIAPAILQPKEPTSSGLES